MNKEEKEIVEKAPLDASLKVNSKEARKLLKENGGKVQNGDVEAFVRLKDINKIYPNGVQAVYDFNMDIKEHEFIVLVGPSGCGKSTTLRMVAGLEDITSGYLYINKVLSNYLPSKDRDISMVFQSYALYPQMTVFDNIAFPLRSRKYTKVKKVVSAIVYDELQRLLADPEALKLALEEADDKKINFTTKRQYLSTKFEVLDETVNALGKVLKASVILEKKDEILASALSKKEEEIAKYKAEGYEINDKYELFKDGKVCTYLAKLNKKEIRDKVFEAARILDLGPYLDRRPKELSGGQMQRVALGRAIVRDAKLFLMDEPLSNLDAKLRVQMRSEIVRIHEQIGATSIYVTHDQTEAMTMATRIAVMSKGWIQQIGTPQEIYSNPNNIFVATFIGSPAMNIFNAKYNHGLVTFNDGYQIDLRKEFDELHTNFYKTKIAELEKLIEKDGFIRLHAIDVADKLLSSLDNQEKVIELLKEFNELVGKVNELGEKANVSVEALKNCSDVSAIKGHVLTVRKSLMHFKDITSYDLSLLHNAQAFSKKVEHKKEDTLYYNKRKHENFITKRRHVKMNKFKINDSVVFTNNLYVIAKDLIDGFKLALSGEHGIRVGIRPEHIHLDEEYTNPHKSSAFQVESEVVELLGSELLVHFTWNDKEMISKISTGTLVKPHTTINLTFNKDKIKIFDELTGDAIKAN